MKTAKPFFRRCAWFLDCEDRDHVLHALQVRGSQLGVNFPWGTCDKVWRLGGHHSLEGTLLVSSVSGARDVAKRHAMHRTDPPQPNVMQPQMSTGLGAGCLHPITD